MQGQAEIGRGDGWSDGVYGLMCVCWVVCGGEEIVEMTDEVMCVGGCPSLG